jgi:hypothetical protein
MEMSGPDEYAQEWFSDDSVDLQCVLSWRLRDSGSAAPHLMIDLHNSFILDSAYGRPRPERIQSAIRQLKQNMNIRGHASD